MQTDKERYHAKRERLVDYVWEHLVYEVLEDRHLAVREILHLHQFLDHDYDKPFVWLVLICVVNKCVDQQYHLRRLQPNLPYRKQIQYRGKDSVKLRLDIRLTLKSAVLDVVHNYVADVC